MCVQVDNNNNATDQIIHDLVFPIHNVTGPMLQATTSVSYTLVQAHPLADRLPFVFNYVADWRPYKPTTGRKRKDRVIRDSGAEFCRQLKANIEENEKAGINESAGIMNIDVYKKAGSQDESQNRIDDILACIKNAKLKLTEFNCILGLELANQKLMYFKDKCDKCSRYKESGDEYVIFECSSCKCKPGNNCEEFVKRYIR
jgi:hypothetical protein